MQSDSACADYTSTNYQLWAPLPPGERRKSATKVGSKRVARKQLTRSLAMPLYSANPQASLSGDGGGGV